tara:strand:+ start:51036 stop:51710 length:675 start_codon:yes stop_codon:yes gene_type:complete
MSLIATPSFAEGVAIKNFGHSSLLFKGDGMSLLLNPFKAVGCAEGLKEPKLKVDIILASSQLADEGARTAKGIFFVQPGSYLVDGFSFEGFSVPHDRVGGRRFGMATLWTWEQSGIKFAHLGGGAGSLSVEDRFLLGRPDVLIIAVGGGRKVYNGKEAAKIVQDLKPKIIIPVQYIKDTATTTCDLTDIEPFLNETKDITVKKVGVDFKLAPKISNEMTILLMN